MNKADITILMCRVLAGEATETEQEELNSILAADQAAAAEFQLLSKYWQQPKALSSAAVEEALTKSLAQLGLRKETTGFAPETSPRRSISRWRYAAAAGIAGLLFLGSYGLYKKLNRPDAASPIAANGLLQKENSSDSRSIIELADGSKVWLNVESRLQYPQQFNDSSRDVYLTGEAFFNVTKNEKKPFIIHLPNGTVRVVGTSFNVRSYANESKVETSVSTGKVAFIPSFSKADKKGDTIFITPNNKLTFDLNAGNLTLSKTVASEDRAWTEGKLLFRNESLESIAVKLGKSFKREFRFQDEAPKHFIFTGSFENNSLEEILFYLSKSKEFYYKVSDSDVVIALPADTLHP